MIKHKLKFLLALFFLIIILSFTPKTYAISLDTTFGNDGKIITTFGNEAAPLKLMQQSNGKKIIIGAIVDGNNRNWAIARYNTDGKLDNSFGNNGIIIKDFDINGQQNSHGDFLKSVLFQPDGKIVVGGSSAINPSLSRWTLARYNQNGNLDESFGDKGIVITTLRDNFVIEYINSLIIQPDNKIIAVGVSHISNTDIAIARYNSEGKLDTTFGGGDGIVTTPVGSNNDRGIAAALQNDGKIIVLGEFDAGGHDEIFLVRYTQEGNLDIAFDGDGKVITRMGDHDGAGDIAIQTDGKIIVTGGTNINGSGDTYIARYNANGALDHTFGTGGKVIKSFSTGNDGANALILRSDGKIILGGYEETGGASGNDFALRRFNNNGTLDTDFGTNGSFIIPIGKGNDVINSIALQSDGKIIAAGSVYNGTYNDWALVRYSEFSHPQPFLDLPWDYQKKGKTFNDAALAINSYFDHEYPFLGGGLLEDNTIISRTLIPYFGPARLGDNRYYPQSNYWYSRHDGYDYGMDAGVQNGDPVYPAAAGSAEYKYDNAGGNAIFIDHGNHYQTRYYHLQDMPQLATISGKTQVDRNTIIGNVGSTGINTTGPHIHIGLFYDQNRDGNFDNDVPYGAADPFGWEPDKDQEPNLKDPDPWEYYLATPGGIKKRGTKSYYLWKTNTNTAAMPVTLDGGEIMLADHKFNFPPGSYATNFNVHLNSTPFIKAEILGKKYKSILPTLKAEAYNSIGNIIDKFLSAFTLTINFTENSLYNIKPDTLSIYSSNDMNTWAMESTTFANHIATAKPDHFTYFALMGEIDDTQAPITEAELIGDEGVDNWFRSDVTLNLNATDNKLGVDYTLFKKDDKEWQTYTTPQRFTDEGDYEVQFYSGDKWGNVEDVRTVEFHIDKTLPEAEIIYDPSIFDLKITGKDSASETNVAVNKSSVLHPKYIISDRAGNTLTLNTDKLKVGKQTTLNIKTLQYNTDSVIRLDKNIYFTLVLANKKNKITQLDQFYSFKGDKKIFTNYSHKTNVTKVYTKSAANKYIKEEKQGIVLLKLYTQNGALKYSL